MKPRLSLILVAAGAISASLVLTSPADARTSHAAPVMTTRTAQDSATTPIDSTTNAGYLADPTAQSFTFEANVNLPTIQCSPSITNAIVLYMSVHGNLSNGFLADSGLSAVLHCVGATPSYQVSVFVDEVGSPSIAVNAGEHLKITGSVAPHSEQYTFADVSKGVSKTISGSGLHNVQMQFDAQHGTANNPYNFPPFSNYVFYGITENGQAFPPGYLIAFNQVDSNNTVLVETTQLSATGKAFGMLYRTNQPATL